MPLATAVLLGIAFLFMFYRAVELHWPESYFGATDLSSYGISVSPLRYLAFRFGPPFATCLFVAVTMRRINESPWAGALGVGAGHALLTVGWALAQAAQWPPPVFRQRFPVVFIRCIVGVGLLVAASLAAWSSRSLSPLVPPAEEISATLWAALIAGIVGAFVVRISSGGALDEYELSKLAVRSLPRALWDRSSAAASEVGADVVLVRAVMAVENLQRPPWFRRLERMKGRVWREGTYGIMQVRSRRPLGDDESIDLAVKERFARIRVRDSNDSLDRDALQQFAGLYNADPNFLALLESAYYVISDGLEPR